MIKHHPFATLPAVNHRGIKSHFHFVPEGSGLGKASSLGPLIAWNDDELAPMSGFPEHPHRDADIVTYVREGAIVHEDTIGNKGSAGPGEVQSMSAGAGIRHSERNDQTVPVKLFQLWFTPRTAGGAARWGMSKLPDGLIGFVALASGDPADTGAVQINTNARVMAARLAAGEELVHQMSAAGRGYLVPTDAAITVNGTRAGALDGVLVSGETTLTIRAEAATEIVFVELF